MSPIIVVFLLFLVLGPLGLWMLWRNNRFSVAWKVVLTILVCIYTVVILWVVYVVVGKALDAAMGQFPLD